jgi:hypothetical protein
VGRAIAKPKARKASAREAMTPQEALVSALNDRGKNDVFCQALLRIACFTTKHRGHAWTLVSPRTSGHYLDNDKMRARLEAAGFERDPDLPSGWFVIYASDVQLPEAKSEQFKATVAALELPSDPWKAPFTGFDEAGWFIHPDCNADIHLPPLDAMEVADTSSPLSRLTPLTPPTPIDNQEAADPPPEMEEPLPPAHAAALERLKESLYGPDAPKYPQSLAEHVRAVELKKAEEVQEPLPPAHADAGASA